MEHEVHLGGILSASPGLVAVDPHSFLRDVVVFYDAGLSFAEACRLAFSRNR